MGSSRKATVTIGHDVRHWTTFEIEDLTDEEYALLNESGEEDPASIDLLSLMMDSGRLSEIEDHSDDNPTFFEETDYPSVIGVRFEEDD